MSRCASAVAFASVPDPVPCPVAGSAAVPALPDPVEPVGPLAEPLVGVRVAAAGGGAPASIAGESDPDSPTPAHAVGDDPIAAGCPVFLTGVPIDAAGSRWLSATARAVRAGDPAAAQTLWLALRPRFRGWAVACLRQRGSDDLRRDGAPWLLEDLLQEAYPVLLAVVADWPDGDEGSGTGTPTVAGPSEAAPSDAASDPAGSPDTEDGDGPAAPSEHRHAPGPWGAGDRNRGSAGDGSFLPWLLAVAPRRLYGAFAALREPAPRPLPAGARPDPALLADGTAEAAEAAARLDALAAALDPLDAALLLAHVVDGEPVGRAGRRLGLDRGAAYHRWRRLRARLRAELLA